MPSHPKPLCARLAGFSLHAAQSMAADDREDLERLCRYGLRPPFSPERLARRADGRILYHLRRPWPHPAGATCVVLEPLDFLRRLAALIPAPYAHTIRYHGVFANRSRLRNRLSVPPVPPAADTRVPESEGAGLVARSRAMPRRRFVAEFPWPGHSSFTVSSSSTP